MALTVEIAEGEPRHRANVVFEGLDAIPADHRERLQSRSADQVGAPRDQSAFILASHAHCLADLRDHGFPYGSVRIIERPEAEPRSVQLAVAADTGPESVFGPIAIQGVASVDEDVIRRELAFDEGDQYQLSRLTESQRRLYSLELFQFVNITPRVSADRGRNAGHGHVTEANLAASTWRWVRIGEKARSPHLAQVTWAAGANR